jgi:PAS domain S-box-containing protein
MPSLLFVTPDAARADAVRAAVDALPGGEAELEIALSLDLPTNAGDAPPACDVVLLDADLGTEVVGALLAQVAGRPDYPPIIVLESAEEPPQTERWIRFGAADCIPISGVGGRGFERAIRHAQVRHKDTRYEEVRNGDEAEPPGEVPSPDDRVSSEARTSSEARIPYRSIVRNSLDIITLLDRNGTIRYESPSIRALGYEPNEMVGESPFDFIHEDDLERVVETFAVGIVEPGYTATVEYRFREKDGSWRYLESRAQNLLDDPEVEGVIVYSRDISGRKEMERALRRSREQLRNLTNHLQSVREEERTRISQEVHDVLGQRLTSLRMDVSWLKRRLGGEPSQGKPSQGQSSQGHPSQNQLLQGEDFRGRLGDMEDKIDSTMQAARRISAELRPGVLDDLGLGAALEWQARQFESRTGIRCTVETPATALDLSPDLSTNLFRVFQETLTNVARHAGASAVEARLEATAEELLLEVRDDGRGIRESEVQAPSSLGLLGMRERVGAWGGSIQFEGQPGQGTTVTVRVPRHASNDDASRANSSKTGSSQP